MNSDAIVRALRAPAKKSRGVSRSGILWQNLRRLRLQQRHQQQRNDVDDLDQRIHRGARCVLVGIAHCVAGHRRLVRVGTLAADEENRVRIALMHKYTW